jgi:glycosyltransferase involved in cell wall biosynthesis
LYTKQPRYQDAVSTKLRVFCFFVFDVLRLRGFTPVERRAGNKSSKVVHPRLEYIPFFKRVEPAAKAREYNVSCPRLLSIGKFLPRKNFLLLLDTFKDISTRHDCSLTLVGECSTTEHKKHCEDVKQRIVASGLHGKVRLLLNQSYRDVQQLYMQHDIFIMPSIAEPASISQIEAMAHGLPIICADDNGTAHYVSDGANGFVIKADRQSLSKALNNFLEHREEIEEFGRKSIAVLETQFSMNEAYKGLLRLLEHK